MRRPRDRANLHWLRYTAAADRLHFPPKQQSLLVNHPLTFCFVLEGKAVECVCASHVPQKSIDDTRTTEEIAMRCSSVPYAIC